MGRWDRNSSLDIINRNVIRELTTEGHIIVPEAGFGPVDVEIRHQWPPPLEVPTVPTILWQPWEYGGVPAEWVDWANQHAAGVFAYTQVCADLWRQSGLDVPVFVVPLAPSFEHELGADLAKVRERPRGAVGDGALELLAIGGPVLRKCWPELVSAWALAYDSGMISERSTLTLKYDPAVYGQLPFDPDQVPNLEVCTEDMTPLDMAWFIAGHTHVISTSGGEGWNMTLTDALAVGTPVIATSIPVHVEVLHDYRPGWDDDSWVTWIEKCDHTPIDQLPDTHHPAGTWMYQPKVLNIATAMTRARNQDHTRYGWPKQPKPITWCDTADAITDAISEVIA